MQRISKDEIKFHYESKHIFIKAQSIFYSFYLVYCQLTYSEFTKTYQSVRYHRDYTYDSYIIK